MTNAKDKDFGSELARMMPAMLRVVSKQHEKLFSEGHLSVTNIVVLDLLKERGSSKMSEIAAMLGLTMSAATGIVDKMVALDLVKRERSAQDRRVVRVELLKKGKDISDKMDVMRRDCGNMMYSVLTEREKKEYLRLIKKVHDHLVAKNQPGA